MKQLKKLFSDRKKILFLILGSLVAFIFYWYELRPLWRNQYCHSLSVENAIENAENNGKYLPKDLDHYFLRCLRSKGAFIKNTH